jgi:hypothetical protein
MFKCGFVRSNFAFAMRDSLSFLSGWTDHV